MDDTPNKLRGQPDSLLAAPVFNLPLSSSDSSTPHPVNIDTFLLQLVAALDEISTQSNFANFIAKNGWNDSSVFSKREDEFARKGTQILAKASISVDPNAKATVPVQKLHFQIGTTMNFLPALSAKRPLNSVAAPSESLLFYCSESSAS